jgi:Protein of unknown function (DUF1592)/Protein of unknown function (DUF1588)/Protein of unknown function (DUF1585)/Protein of unknown function (DUF1587)/Protein of unknown function (DUF1595)/Planctomycete cytochrome C
MLNLIRRLAMNRKLFLDLIIVACVIGTPGLIGQDTNPPRAKAAEFQKTILPFLNKNCILCHNEKLKTGNLNLETFRDANGALMQTEVWEKVLDKLSTGRMPPPALPAPPKSEMAAVTAWIEKLLDRSGSIPNSDPGRVTARRLNRVEYNNTIRDLLGVSLHPAAEFPLDDSGYGFDSIGDVLSLSPMLMEKYMAAAQSVSRAAVYGETYLPKPTKLVRFLPKKFQDDGASSGNILPFSMRGAMYGTFDFPVDAEYEFRVRLANYRSRDKYLAPSPKADVGIKAARGPRRPLTEEDRKAFEEEARKAFPPVRMALSLDGKTILTDVVEGSVDYQYARGESVVRLRVNAGEHFLRASFPELADLPDPRTNVNGDGRRKLYVDYMDIIGPYNPTSAPPDSYRQILICGHVDGRHKPECARRIVENLARRAYRRPVAQQELDELTGLVELVRREGDSFQEGIRVALQAILTSPNFLFRIERDPEPRGRAGAYLLSEHELASRLSYFLWSSMPDEELLRAADERMLRKPAFLEAQARRMLQDPKSSALVENFAEQWLNLRLLGRKKPDPARFPMVDDELLDAMRRETNLFVGAVIHEDRSILDFLDGRFTFVNGPLARHYGISGVKGEEFQRVELDGERRGGLVTQASILTLSSYATRTSPVIRGKWVLENLLGTPPPPPPADVPPLDESSVGSTASMREKLEQHRANPSCSVCHNQMDPIGFGLENYDASGVWRTEDGKFPIDSSGTLPNGKSFHGAKDLKQILREQADAFTRNLTEKLLTYALGRGLEPYDSTTVDQISRQAAANNYRFSTLVMEIVNSKPFQMRRGSGESHESE